MDKQEAENQKITVYWWNFGKKTLDFKGSYKDYLLKRGITVEDIVHPTQKDIKGWRFTISISSVTAILDIYGPDYAQACDDAIKVFLTIMGDKAKFITPTREFNINW
jgi:hypothetical protein